MSSAHGGALPLAVEVTAAIRQAAGVGRYTRELARALAVRGGRDYLFFAADRVAVQRLGRLLGVEAGRCRASPLPDRLHTWLWRRAGVRLPAEWWTGALSAFHATDFVAPPLARARLVLTVHDLSFLRVPERAHPGLRRFLARQVPRSVARAAQVLADSRSTRDDLVQLLSVPPERVSVAYPGVSAAMGRVSDPARLARVAAAHGLDRPFVLGVGTLEPRKDWPTLIAAFERSLAATHSLVIVGRRGWLTEPIDRAVAASPADVRLLGHVPDEDLPVLYGLASAFAYPSVYEGFGLPPLEAMACGAPTVVAAASSLPEVVGDAALTVEPGDAGALAAALERLVRDGELRRRLGAAGPARAASFTWEACARAVELAYARALGESE